MDLQQLRIAVAVADCGSISQAARQLYMGQPNLSKSIKELEGELGRPLFRRTARGMEPTQSGRDFLSHARSIVSQMDAMLELYRPRTVSDALRLSVCVPRASYVAAAYYRWASAAAKGPFHLEYRETTGFSTIDAVVLEEAQLGIVRYPAARAVYSEGVVASRGLHLAPLWDYHMMVLVHQSHPLCAAPRISTGDLSSYPEIAHGNLTPIVPSSDDESRAERVCGVLMVYDRAGEFDALRSVSGAYMWVSPMPQDVLDRQELTVLPCTDAPLYRDALIWKGRMSTAVSGFVDEVRREINHLMGVGVSKHPRR